MSISKQTQQTSDRVTARSISLADLVDEKRWVTWVEEITTKGELKKMPKNPATGGNARVPTDPKTYGTRAAAEKRWQKIKTKGAKGGIGVVLGELPSGQHLVGIDLDGCLHARLDDLAEEVVERFHTYTEISPSGHGVKLYFLMTAADMSQLHDLIGPNAEGNPAARKTFAAGEHREVAIDIARFYATTEQRLDGSPENFRLVPFTDVAWIVNEVGPRYLAEQKQIKSRPLDNAGRRVAGKLPIAGNKRKANGHDKADYFASIADDEQADLDRSGSGYRFMPDRHADGMNEQQARAAILADQEELGKVFCAVTGLDLSIGMAIWHSLKSDKSQRDLLDGAVKAAARDEDWLAEHPGAESGILYLTKKTLSLSDRRNDAIHAPCHALPGDKDFEIKPITFFQNPRAQKLLSKDILKEFEWYERTADALRHHAKECRFALDARLPWPDEPQLPALGQERLAG